MSSIFQALRLAVRRLRKNRGSNVVAVLTMALGIGLTAATYTLIDVMLFQGLPFEDEKSLVRLSSSQLQDGIDELPVSGPDFAVWIEQQEAFEGLAGFHLGTMNLSDAAELPERYSGAWISTNFLDLLRLQPALGRGFRPEDAEPGADSVALIGHRIWAQRYGADPGVIGR
ncbi:MAG: ABC transporter permease, partial [Acidobacteriota bacterium]